MNGLRNTVFDSLCNDSEINGAGYDVNNLYPAFSRDSVPEVIEGRQFGIIRWGTTEPGLGRVNAVTMELWFYNRDPDYGPIGDALLRSRMVMDGLPGRQVDVRENAWVLGVHWDGAGTDGWDDLYKAIVRSESYTITASGN